MSWYIQSIKNYCNFSGRARKTEYRMFTLVSTIIVFVLGIIDGIIGTNNYGADPKTLSLDNK